MCMEDIKIARSLDTEAKAILLVPGNQRILGRSDTRVKIVVSGAFVSAFSVFPEGVAGSDTVGFRIANQDCTLVFDIETYGSLIRGEWFANDNGLGNTIIVVSSNLNARTASELRK